LYAHVIGLHRLSAVSPQVTIVINAAVHCQYFPRSPQLSSSQRVSLFLGRYQIILFGDRGMQMLACPRPLRGGAQPGVEPATVESQVPCPTNSATASPVSSAVFLRSFYEPLHYTDVLRTCTVLPPLLCPCSTAVLASFSLLRAPARGHK